MTTWRKQLVEGAQFLLLGGCFAFAGASYMRADLLESHAAECMALLKRANSAELREVQALRALGVAEAELRKANAPSSLARSVVSFPVDNAHAGGAFAETATGAIPVTFIPGPSSKVHVVEEVDIIEYEYADEAKAKPVVAEVAEGPDVGLQQQALESEAPPLEKKVALGESVDPSPEEMAAAMRDVIQRSRRDGSLESPPRDEAKTERTPAEPTSESTERESSGAASDEAREPSAPAEVAGESASKEPPAETPEAPSEKPVGKSCLDGDPMCESLG